MSSEDVLEFLREKIPMIYDLNKEDLVYKKRNPYYMVYKYITKRDQIIQKAIEWVENNIYYLDDGKEFIAKANPEELLKILKEGK